MQSVSGTWQFNQGLQNLDYCTYLHINRGSLQSRGEEIETFCNRGSDHPKSDECMVCVTSKPVRMNGIRIQQQSGHSRRRATPGQ